MAVATTPASIAAHLAVPRLVVAPQAAAGVQQRARGVYHPTAMTGLRGWYFLSALAMVQITIVVAVTSTTFISGLRIDGAGPVVRVTWKHYVLATPLVLLVMMYTAALMTRETYYIRYKTVALVLALDVACVVSLATSASVPVYSLAAILATTAAVLVIL